MKGWKKAAGIVMALTVAAVSGACAPRGKRSEEVPVNIGVLKGPTGMGAVMLMKDAEEGVYENYEFTITPEVTDIVARMSNGDLDIGALPTNVAANLYNKTNGGVKLIALNCLGVLNILERGNDINGIKDLKGKTIYCHGQGANPEYVLKYLLRENGVDPEKDVDIVFGDPSEIAAKMISGDIDICMLPVPASTTILMKDPGVRNAIDMTECYRNTADDGSELTMGCLAVNSEFAKEHPEAVDLFLERYRKGIEDLFADTDRAAKLITEYGITGNEDIAKAAIPYANIACITGKDMRPAVEGHYKVLFDADPASVGGSIPGDDFYYGE